MTRTLRAVSILILLIHAPALRANITFQITHEHCSNSGGQVLATVNGGVPPYTYSWSNGATTNYINGVVAGSYMLTVTDNVGAQQVNTAVVQNLPNWEWLPGNVLAQGIPSCMPGPEPNNSGYVFFGGDIGAVPQGPAPHDFDHVCLDNGMGQSIPSDFNFMTPAVLAVCYWALAGELYAVNYTDANGCPGYMEALVPQPPEFFPVQVLDIQGACSGGANGSLHFSCAPEPDYIYGVYPRLYNDQWQLMSQFGNLATNWTGGWTYDVPGLPSGTYALVRRMVYDPLYAAQFPCGDTTYMTIPDLGPTCGHISGSVLIDADEDCAVDFTDVEVPEMILEFTPGPYYATTNSMGAYSINLPLGSYSVAQQTTVLDEHCLGNPSLLTVAGSMTFDLLDTALMAKDVQLTMASGPARPGFPLGYAIDLDNLTSATSQLNSLVMTFDANASYVSATPTPSSVVGNTITWTNLGSLYYFGHRDVNVQLQVPPDVGLIGTDLQASAVLTSNGDVNTANNSATWAVTVTGSYDPNDKVATTSSGYSRDLYYIDVDQWIDYVIRFQNTGTDTAFTVVVTDTLPTALDAGTLIMGAGSHPFTWSLQEGGTLKFYFINILLPDSNVNEPRSHGFVSFRIRPRQPVLPGTIIENTANIYFDYNPPVITEPNVLVAEFSTAVGEQDPAHVRLQPNPVSDQLRVSSDALIGLIRIIAADGREVSRSTVRTSFATIDIFGLKCGAYLLEATMNDGTIARERFIKQ